MSKGKKEPKILFFDLETSHMKVASFSLYPNYIDHGNILQDWKILTAAWKWAGGKRVYSKKIDSKGSDKEIIIELSKAIEQADIVVAHNGDKFDFKKLNARRILNGLKPIVKPLTIDTLKVCRKEFAFSSNRLDFVAKALGVGAKMDTRKGLWLDALENKRSALKEMVKYNKMDVIVLEDVFNVLRPFITNFPNMRVLLGEDGIVCRNCGSQHLTKNGFRYTNAGKYQRYSCSDCGSGSTVGKENLARRSSCKPKN